MIPILPFNPSTITPVVLPPKMELEKLRRMDTYERQTNPKRELEKTRLEVLIKNLDNALKRDII